MGPPPTAGAAGSHETANVIEEYLPDAPVDSRWWYWIAAVPAFALLSTLGVGFFLAVAISVSVVIGVLFFLITTLGVFLDSASILFGLLVLVGGISGLLFSILFVLLLLFASVPGLILSIMFPVALYVDGSAIQEADFEWNPDPELYGLMGVTTVLTSAFMLSIPLALYYLYQRHVHVGVP